MNVSEARQLTNDWLRAHGFAEARVKKSRTIESPFGGADKVFVTVVGWSPNPEWDQLMEYSRQHGFAVIWGDPGAIN